MSQQLSGKHKCDRCGADVGNGAITEAVVVADYTEDGHVLNYHFCREAGCDKKVLSSANLRWRKDNNHPTGVGTPGE